MGWGLDVPYPPTGEVGLFCIVEGEFPKLLPNPLLLCPELLFWPFKLVVPCIPIIACCSEGW